MSWNPFLNALAASAYISGVVLLMNYIGSIGRDVPDVPIDGLAAISLLVFSVAVMAFLFFYHPLTLFLEHKRSEAIAYFLKTLAIFGVTTALVFAAVIALAK